MGLLFVFFVEDYGLSRAQASWPQNVLIVCSQLSGLVVGALQQHFSMADIAVMSSVLASVALVASAFSRHVVWVSLTLGAMYGLGMGMFLTCVCVYSMMIFDKYKGTAVSLILVAWSVSGIYAPAVLTCLHDVYALQGGLLICGALILHAVPLSMLLKNPLFLELGCLKNVLSRLYTQTLCKANGNYVKRTSLPVDEPSPGQLNTLADDNARVPGELPRASLISLQPCPTCIEEADLCSSKRGSFQQPNVSCTTKSAQTFGVLKASVLLLRDPAFYVFLAATVVGEYSLMAFAMTIVDYAMDKGVKLDFAVQLVVFGALGHILGRLFIVPLSDWVPCFRYPLFAMSFVIEALCTLAMPHVFTVTSIVALRIAETVVQGFAGAVRGILLVHYLGIKTVATCTGLFGFALIPLSLSSASMIGFFRDSIGSYDGFYRMLSAVNIVVAIGLSVFFLADWKRPRRRQSPPSGNCKQSQCLHHGKEPLATLA
ncbi:uncharacterized protein LOC144121813 isoform X2 [Amblyomma americanum]